MVIFHSYVILPEGNWFCVNQKWSDVTKKEPEWGKCGHHWKVIGCMNIVASKCSSSVDLSSPSAWILFSDLAFQGFYLAGICSNGSS